VRQLTTVNECHLSSKHKPCSFVPDRVRVEADTGMASQWMPARSLVGNDDVGWPWRRRG
jgi:hypothetical protein